MKTFPTISLNLTFHQTLEILQLLEKFHSLKLKPQEISKYLTVDQKLKVPTITKDFGRSCSFSFRPFNNFPKNAMVVQV